MTVDVIQLEDIAINIRDNYKRCQELADALRQETSWYNMIALGQRLQLRFASWNEALNEYNRLSPECEYGTPDEVAIHLKLNKMVDDYQE